mgnify:CR=1 FL=1
MTALIVHCPRTGRVIDSGIDTDPQSLMAIGSEQLRVMCPHCQTIHVIALTDGKLDERRQAATS